MLVMLSRRLLYRLQLDLVDVKFLLTCCPRILVLALVAMTEVLFSYDFITQLCMIYDSQDEHQHRNDWPRGWSLLVDSETSQ